MITYFRVPEKYGTLFVNDTFHRGKTLMMPIHRVLDSERNEYLSSGNNSDTVKFQNTIMVMTAMNPEKVIKRSILRD
jgi:hypothetical protein